jgi:hypothetical protein
MSSHFHISIDKGWSTPANFKWLAFILWQVSHSYTYLAIVNFHIGPPEIFLQILIHLGASRVNGEYGKMSFIKDGFLNLFVSGNHKTFPKPYHII